MGGMAEGEDWEGLGVEEEVRGDEGGVCWG